MKVFICPTGKKYHLYNFCRNTYRNPNIKEVEVENPTLNKICSHCSNIKYGLRDRIHENNIAPPRYVELAEDKSIGSEKTRP